MTASTGWAVGKGASFRPGKVPRAWSGSGFKAGDPSRRGDDLVPRRSTTAAGPASNHRHADVPTCRRRGGADDVRATFDVVPVVRPREYRAWRCQAVAAVETPRWTGLEPCSAPRGSSRSRPPLGNDWATVDGADVAGPTRPRSNENVTITSAGGQPAPVLGALVGLGSRAHKPSRCTTLPTSREGTGGPVGRVRRRDQASSSRRAGLDDEFAKDMATSTRSRRCGTGAPRPRARAATRPTFGEERLLADLRSGCRSRARRAHRTGARPARRGVARG